MNEHVKEMYRKSQVSVGNMEGLMISPGPQNVKNKRRAKEPIQVLTSHAPQGSFILNKLKIPQGHGHFMVKSMAGIF